MLTFFLLYWLKKKIMATQAEEPEITDVVVIDKYDVYAIAPRGESDWDTWVQ